MSRLGWTVAALAVALGSARGEVVLRRHGDVVLAGVELEVGANGRDASGLAWRQAGDAAVGTLHGSEFDATVRLAPTGGAIGLDVEIDYIAPATIDHEVVHLRLAGPARAIGRDLRLAAVTSPLRVGPGTPALVLTPGLAVAGERGFAAARYVPRHDETDVDLVVDDRAAHPFSVYDTCLERLPSPPDWSALERRHPQDRLGRGAGERVRAHATLYALHDGQGALPLVLERWPAGARAAIVFTDHADRTDPAALRAVLYGSSAGGGAAPRGFIGRGLALTKTFFARGGIGTLADDEATRHLADALAQSGSEIGNHSITAHADARERVQDALDVFAPWHATTWIDHEPYTNCEAVSNQGWDDRPPFGVRDLLAARGYRWLWAATDEKSGELNLFGGETPVVFPFPADRRMWVFRSTWFAAAPDALAHRLRDEALDDLERRHGLAVLHTYLSPSARTTPTPAYRRMLVVRPAPGGGLELDPVFDAMLARLATRTAAGSLLVAPWRDVGDRLRALADVVVRYAPDGSAVVENHGASRIHAVTLAVPGQGVDLDVARAAVVGRRAAADGASVWLDLEAGAAVTVRASRAGAPVSFLPIEDVVVEAR